MILAVLEARLAPIIASGEAEIDPVVDGLEVLCQRLAEGQAAG